MKTVTGLSASKDMVGIDDEARYMLVTYELIISSIIMYHLSAWYIYGRIRKGLAQLFELKPRS